MLGCRGSRTFFVRTTWRVCLKLTVLGSAPKMSGVVLDLGICVSKVPRECWCCGSQASISTQFNTALAVPSILEIQSCLHTFGMSFALSRKILQTHPTRWCSLAHPPLQQSACSVTTPCNNDLVVLCILTFIFICLMCCVFTFSREMTLSYLSCYTQQQIQAQRNACWQMHDSILPKFQAPS